MSLKLLTDGIERNEPIPIVELIPALSPTLSGIEHKARIQSLLSQMLLRAEKRGRPVKNEIPSEMKHAA